MQPHLARRLGPGGSAGKPEQGGCNGAHCDGHVQPGKEGALISKEGFGLNAHGRGAGLRVLRGCLARIEVPVEPALFPAATLPIACLQMGLWHGTAVGNGSVQHGTAQHIRQDMRDKICKLHGCTKQICTFNIGFS